MSGKLAGRRPTVPEVQEAIDMYVDGNFGRRLQVTQLLHVIVEDGNYEDRVADFIVEHARTTGYGGALAIALLVRALSRSQRGRLRV